MQVSVFMCTFDSGVVNLALPVIREDLHLTMAQVKWVIICYTATAALTLPISAWLGRRFGIERMFMLGIIIFALASGLCGLAWDLSSLITMRIIAALGASLILSLNKVLVLRIFPRKMHGRALGIVGTTFALGVLSGIGAGGVLIHFWGWQSIFLISFPIGLIAFSWNYVMLKRFGLKHEVNKTLLFDWQGMLWMFVGFGAVLWLINHWLGDHNEALLLSIILSVAAGVFIAGWLRHEFAGQETFLQLHLLRNSPLGYNFSNTFSVRILMAGTNFIVPFYLQGVLMLSPAYAGLILASGAISMGIIGPFAGAMSDCYGMQKIITLGLALMTFGIMGYIALPSTNDPDTLIYYIIGIITLQAIIGAGSTFFSAANTNSCLHSISKDQQASVSGLLSVNLMAGTALGSTLAAEFFNLVGGVKHVKDAVAQGSNLVFPPHAFSWLFSFCAIWLALLTFYATTRTKNQSVTLTD